MIYLNPNWIGGIWRINSITCKSDNIQTNWEFINNQINAFKRQDELIKEEKVPIKSKNPKLNPKIQNQIQKNRLHPVIDSFSTGSK